MDKRRDEFIVVTEILRILSEYQMLDPNCHINDLPQVIKVIKDQLELAEEHINTGYQKNL